METVLSNYFQHISYSQDFLNCFNGHGFLIRDNNRHYTELQEGPLCPLLGILVSY